MTLDPRRARGAPPPPPPPPEPLTTEPVPDSTKVEVDGSNESKSTETQDSESDGFKLKFCTVCASNQNRSMEAHLRLATANPPFPTISFGTGSLVRLPGPSINQPNVYNFNTTSYNAMYEELLSKDPRLYKANGLLNMLDRNRHVKWGPERFQDWQVGLPRLVQAGAVVGNAGERREDKGSKGVEGGVVDIIITCEERCWDAVVDDLLTRGSPLNRPVHVFNVDIRDNHEEAYVGGKAIIDLATELNKAANEERSAWATSGGNISGWDSGGLAARKGFDERVPDILSEWQERWPQLPALWTLAWF